MSWAMNPPEPPDDIDEDTLLCSCGRMKEEHTMCGHGDCDMLHCPNDQSGDSTFDLMTEHDIREEKMLRRWEADREEGLA